MKLSARVPRDSPIQSIRATAKGITEIDFLPPKFIDCSELFISDNSISKIDKIDQFRRLSRLMIEYNLIQYVEDLLPLGGLANLVELRLEGNPVCRWPLWEIFTINICLKLRLLNGKAVIRDKSQYLLALEQKVLDALYYLEISKDVAKAMKGRKPPTPDELAEMVKDAMQKRPKKEFFAQVRLHSGTTDPDSYFEYLTDLAKRKSKGAASLLPGDAKQFKIACARMAEAGDDLEAFAKAVSAVASSALQSLGVAGVKYAIAETLEPGERQLFLDLASEAPAQSRPSKPKLPFLNLQQMKEEPGPYSPKLVIQPSLSQGEFDQDYSPALEIHKNMSFERIETGENAGGPTAEELQRFHEENNDDDEEHASGFDQLVQQSVAEETMSQKYDDSESQSDASGEKGQRRRKRISSWMSGTSGSEMTPPSSARSRRDRKERRQSMHDNIKMEKIREFASQVNGFLVWKFFKVWTLRNKQRINSRMRKRMLVSSVSGMIPRVQLPNIAGMDSLGTIPKIESVGMLRSMESTGSIPTLEGSKANGGRLRGSASFLLSARERRAFPVPMIPSQRKDVYNQQLKLLVDNPIVKRISSARTRSRSDLSAD